MSSVINVYNNVEYDAFCFWIETLNQSVVYLEFIDNTTMWYNKFL